MVAKEQRAGEDSQHKIYPLRACTNSSSKAPLIVHSAMNLMYQPIDKVHVLISHVYFSSQIFSPQSLGDDGVENTLHIPSMTMLLIKLVKVPPNPYC